MSTLFISYSSKDRPTAEIFYGKLIEMGYEPPFRDDHPDSGIPAGSQWEQELYRKLRLGKALIVLVSRNWLDSKWCFAELAYAKAMGKEFFPVLIDDSPDVPSVVAERQGIRFSDPDIWQRLRRGLVEADLAPENDFPWPVAGFDECPYPGLEPFEAHHAGVYFGRDDEILELREQLNQMTDKGEPRLLYVVGASGSGKSSLVKAGLVPRLTRKESNRWCVLPTFRWNELRAKGRDWPEQLAMCLRGVWRSENDSRLDWRTLRAGYLVPPLSKEQKKDESEVTKYKAAIARSAESFIDNTKDLLVARDDPNATPLLIIDQFEELLSAADDDTVAPFLDFLGHVMSSRRSPLRCIATVRTDFLAAIQTRAELIAWKDHTDVYSLPLMKPDRFYDVIRHPAETVGITFESDALVDRMVKDTGTNDALPLLAFTLRELYEQYGDDKRFTFDEYDTKLGGLEGCLTEVANELLTEPVEPDGVPHDERERKLHLAFSNHLVRINDKDQFVRRTALWSELPEHARPLLQRFIDRRLITSRLRDENDPKSERVVEVAHEVLFRKWDKLARWLDERRDLLRWRADVERDRAAEQSQWKGLTSRQLAIARDWPHQLDDEMSEREKKWIKTASRKVRNRRLALVSATVLFAVIAIAAVFFAQEARVQTSIAQESQAQEAEQRQKAEWRLYVSQIASAQREWETGRVAIAWRHLDSTRSDFRGWEHSYLYTLFNQNQTTLTGHTEPVTSVAFNPDGTRIVSGSYDNTLKVWDASSGQETLTLKGHTRDVTSVAFIPDGTRIVSGSYDKTLKVWDASSGQETLTLEGQGVPVWSVAFSADGARIVSGSYDKTLKVWDACRGQETLTLKGHSDQVRSVVFSLDGTRIVSGSYDGTLKVWDATSSQETQK